MATDYIKSVQVERFFSVHVVPLGGVCCCVVELFCLVKCHLSYIFLYISNINLETFSKSVRTNTMFLFVSVFTFFVFCENINDIRVDVFLSQENFTRIVVNVSSIIKKSLMISRNN